jgi:hypothetical protein
MVNKDFVLYVVKESRALRLDSTPQAAERLELSTNAADSMTQRPELQTFIELIKKS